MITHRQLTINDHDQLLDLFTQRPELFNGYTDDQYKNQLPTLIPKMLINPLWFNLGIFVGGYLQGAGLMKELTTAMSVPSDGADDSQNSLR